VAVVYPMAFKNYMEISYFIRQLQPNFHSSNVFINLLIDFFRFGAGAEFLSETVHICKKLKSRI